MLYLATLRGHHLFCLVFFRGYGYSKDFVDSLFKIFGSIKCGEVVEVVDGFDDVCRFCPYGIDGVCRYLGVDLIRIDHYALDLLGFVVGDRVGYEDIVAKVCREYIRWRYTVCLSCSWRYVCDVVFKSTVC